MKVDVENPENSEHLSGLQQFHSSMTEQLGLLEAKQTEAAVLLTRNQSELFGKLSPVDENWEVVK